MNFSLLNHSSNVYFIAEMSANHAGSLENALEIVRTAKRAGADCLKIQTYTADTMTIDCDNEYFCIKGGLWDGYKLYDLYRKASIPWEWHRPIQEECARQGLEFFSTPFDKSAVDFLEQIGVGFYKIASFELVDIPLIEYVASKGKPILISCGMGSEEEIKDAVNACYSQGNDKIVLLKCCSVYPANYADMNLLTITDMRERFGVPVGFSDHSLGSLAAVTAAILGACIIEKHFCLSRAIKSPDSEFSMEPNEFLQMVEDVRLVLEAKGKVDYQLTQAEKQSAAFRRSVFTVKPIAKGEIFSDENVRIIRPGYGLQPKHYSQLLGRKAGKAYEMGTPVGSDELADR